MNAGQGKPSEDAGQEPREAATAGEASCDSSGCHLSGCTGAASCSAGGCGKKTVSSVLKKRFRPNARWRCGYQSTGMACSEGPTADGRCCQVASQAETVSDCAENCSCVEQCELASLRAHPQLPSHLDLGPCMPKRSHWYSRQNIAINLAILTGGLLLLSMSVPGREQVFVPGGLSTKHSQILNNRLVKDRCSLCHANPHGEFAGTTQDMLCMNCHQSHMPDASLRSPHDLTRTQLVGLRSDQKNQQGLSQTHCASCHSEHHGTDQDLKKMSDARCQACHEKQFQSLVDGHAEFTDYPYRTRRVIAFDHNSHATKHFAGKNREFQCNTCHSGAATTATGISRGVDYNVGCADCHDQSLRSKSLDGWAVITLPSIEPSDADSGQLADWPTASQFGYEGIVSLPMRYLLQFADTAGANRLLPDSGDLSRVDNDKKQELTVAAAVSTQELIARVASEGQEYWRRRLEEQLASKLGRELNEQELALTAQLTRGISPDLFRKMQRDWFNKPSQFTKATPVNRESVGSETSSNSLVTHSNRSESTTGSKTAGSDVQDLPPLSADEHVSTGGWFVDDEFLSLNYVPSGHADPTLVAWIEYSMLSAAGEVEQGRGPATWLQSDSLLQSCLECHQGSSHSTPVQSFDWKSAGRPAGVKTFTKFNHGPHLKLPAVNQCSYCHQLTSASEAIQDDLTAVSATADVAPHKDFSDIKLDQCTACHREDAAPNDCTTCHSYHVGDEGFAWSRQRFAETLRLAETEQVDQILRLAKRRQGAGESQETTSPK